ncbi:MAG TPA: hypothetical protein VJT09_08175 [Pyrinomonadaceae bacterium]|nr:hypothetical protein [Pyrinomonadaceae bacterium]
MARHLNDTDISEMEQDFELEMDDEYEFGDDSEAGEDQELEGELEGDYGSLAEMEGDEFEIEEETGDEETGGYADRFYELSERGYESEADMDHEVNDLLNEMERDYFFGGLKKRLKSAGKGLLKKGLKYAAGKVPALKALQGITQLTRGNLKGFLGSLAKAGLASAIPGGMAALPALKALGFDPLGDSEANRDAWNNYVEVSREAFEYLAENLNEQADNPMEATRLATNAFRAGLKKAHGRRHGLRHRRVIAGGSPGQRRTRVVYLAPGERLVVKRR